MIYLNFTLNFSLYLQYQLLIHGYQQNFGNHLRILDIHIDAEVSFPPNLNLNLLVLTCFVVSIFNIFKQLCKPSSVHYPALLFIQVNRFPISFTLFNAIYSGSIILWFSFYKIFLIDLSSISILLDLSIIHVFYGKIKLPILSKS